jgi:hypothetical protein
MLNTLPTSKKDYWVMYIRISLAVVHSFVRKVEQLAMENKRIKEEIQTYFYHIHAQNQQEERMQDLHQRRIQTQVFLLYCK